MTLSGSEVGRRLELGRQFPVTGGQNDIEEDFLRRQGLKGGRDIQEKWGERSGEEASCGDTSSCELGEEDLRVWLAKKGLDEMGGKKGLLGEGECLVRRFDGRKEGRP